MTLEELIRRARLWRAGELSPEGGLSTGYPPLDALLPMGGWPHPGLIEILAARPGIGALRLLLPALAALGHLQRWLIWVAPPHLPYAPALQAAGIELSRLLLVNLDNPGAVTAGQPGSRRLRRHDASPRAGQTESELWAFEQALRFEDCGAALYWPGALEALALRRLQLACEAGQSLGVLFRAPECAAQPSPAALRLAMNPLPGSSQVQIQILKCRGSLGERECRLTL